GEAGEEAGKAVLRAEVGEEGDVGVHRAATSWRARSTAATRPSRSCVSASTATLRPTERATRLVSGPIVTAGAAPPIHAYARAAEPEASTTTSPSGGSGESRRVR